MRTRLALSLTLAVAACGDNGSTGDDQPNDAAPPAPKHKVIVMVWDGLRPDSVTLADTPNLAQLGADGVVFDDNHSTYPTFTMMNAASFATGGRPAQTGFYGNTFWAPGPTGNDSAGKPVNFQQPIFGEDWSILSDVDTFFQGKLFVIGSLFEAAQQAGLVTAAAGKSGPAFLQDRKRGGLIVDENFAFPMTLVDAIKAAGKPVPQRTPVAYGQPLDTTAPNPTLGKGVVTLADKVTSDPTDVSGARNNDANLYLMNIYLDQILAPHAPDLSVVWLRTPDTTEHTYGPGSANYRDGLHAQDALLGMLRAKIAALGLAGIYDIVVVSDHGHTTVSGPLAQFPLRKIVSAGAGMPNTVGAVDPNGFSVSGDVRLADLLKRAGFTAFDGSGCTNNPVLSGIKADGSTVYPPLVDTNGDPALCGTVGKAFITPQYVVPATVPAKAIVIAANGGSDYLYVPDHDAATVANAVRFLQSREEVGAIFVASRYGNLAGTLPLDAVELEGMHGRSPDIIVGFNFDETAMIAGLPGIEFESAFGSRGMHGSFSPTDVHNTLYAVGPDFKSGFHDTLPSANVDVAPTVAKILKLELPTAVGRPLDEALVDGAAVADFSVTPKTIMPSAAATGLVMKLPTNPDGNDVHAGVTSYTIKLAEKVLARGGQSWIYFDSARAVRQ